MSLITNRTASRPLPAAKRKLPVDHDRRMARAMRAYREPLKSADPLALALAATEQADRAAGLPEHEIARRLQGIVDAMRPAPSTARLQAAFSGSGTPPESFAETDARMAKAFSSGHLGEPQRIDRGNTTSFTRLK